MKQRTRNAKSALDKKMFLAVLLAVFGVLLFIALALTLPDASSAPR